MDPFELNIEGNIYVVQPSEPTQYSIFLAGEYLGTITPVTQDNTLINWVTSDLLSADLAQKIGEEIESYFM